MFSLKTGRPIARIVGGKLNKEIVFIKESLGAAKKCCDKCSTKCKRRKCCGGCKMCCEKDNSETENIDLSNGVIEPLLNVNERTVDYNAGPSGSGKSTISANKIKNYKKIYPNKDIFIFSRTNIDDDPALCNLGATQIKIDEDIVKNPINVEQELAGGSIVLFDDCNTIQNKKCKEAIDKLMEDIMEVGRKMDITIVITNHLVIPNEKKFARTILNELHTMTVFPKSGSAQQIRYALKTYFGFNNKQVDKILQLKSRWVQISKSYPMYVLHEQGAYIP